MNKVPNDKDLPASYQRGKLLIDTILATAGVVIKKTGYLPFGKGVGGHRALFVDIQLVLVLGRNLLSIQSARARN